ncbi:DUF2690 domain-containing protein [Streptomyces sp. NPDC017979]|uniref:helix-turn-helix domain-containing protein n=1 Tax=Streptomyces sp. NPDC017979 TaxID=3365024 RepID=UPI0037B3C649
MPQWKALPDGLDPDFRELTEQLRRLVDHSGLDLAGLAAETGFDPTSWERYLDAHVVPPHSAVTALARLTGTGEQGLTAVRERAAQASRRSEAGRDRATEQLRVAKVREGLAQRGGARAMEPAPPGEPARWNAVLRDDGGPATPPPAPGRDRGTKRRVVMFLTGVAGALAVIVAAVFLTDLGGTTDDDNGGRPVPVAKAPLPSPAASGSPAPAADAGTDAARPAGVKCAGDDCTGRNPEAMGCGGRFARTVSQATVGEASIEVRYSAVCRAAWARIADATSGDSVRISVDGQGAQKGTVTSGTDAYTPMTATEKGTDAKGCATLATGTTACTVVTP